MWFPQKEARIMWGKNYLFNKWHCKNWKATCKMLKLDHYLTLYTQLTQNEFKTPMRDQKLPEETVKCKLLEITLGDRFFGSNPKSKKSKN